MHTYPTKYHNQSVKNEILKTLICFYKQDFERKVAKIEYELSFECLFFSNINIDIRHQGLKR